MVIKNLMFFFQVLGFFLGIVHGIDAFLAYIEHRKYKVQIVQGNVVNAA